MAVYRPLSKWPFRPLLNSKPAVELEKRYGSLAHSRVQVPPSPPNTLDGIRGQARRQLSDAARPNHEFGGISLLNTTSRWSYVWVLREYLPKHVINTSCC